MATVGRMDVVTSFKELVDVTNREVACLSSLSALRPNDGGKISPAAEAHLIALNARLDCLEGFLEETTKFVASEKKALELIEHIGISVKENRCVLDHLSASLPNYLPGTMPTNASALSVEGPAVAATKTDFATLDEFERVPPATRERATLEEVNACLSAIQGLAKAKRALMDIPRSQLSERDKVQWASLHEQKTADGGLVISDAEMQGIPQLKKAGRGSTRSIVSTLRALGRLSMLSVNGKSCYVVC
jgi:hypothetical protein